MSPAGSSAKFLRRPILSSVLAVASVLGVAGQAARAADTYKVNVSVDVEKTSTFMSPRAVGVQVSLSDDALIDPQTVDLVRAAGVTTLRYPGRDADSYHWSTHKPTRIQGAESRAIPYVAPSTDFGRFVSVLDRTGATAIITVNYGSNLAGTGGGESAEAAAWVAYANGDPSDTKVIGKDSTGYDWKTIGYWAALRSAQPLPTDDGLNFLRIAHPRPLRIRYWEVGNQVYANGYYGDHDKDGGSVVDLHAPYSNNLRESAKLRSKNPQLSPGVYGRNFIEFSKAMKAVDATIKVGAVLNTPPADNAWGPDWNREVLKAAGPVADFAVVHWQPGPVLPPDWKNMDPVALLDAPQVELPKITNSLMELFQKYCGANAQNMQLTFAGFGPAPWPKMSDPILNGLFAADAFVSLMEVGVVNANWVELHNGFLDAKSVPTPAYYGLQMARILLNSNDTFVASRSSVGLLSVHAAKRADGGLGIMLVNKDPQRSATAKVTVSGAKLSAAGMRFDFGPSSSTVARSQINDLGETFTITVPAYTVTDLRIPKAQ